MFTSLATKKLAKRKDGHLKCRCPLPLFQSCCGPKSRCFKPVEQKSDTSLPTNSHVRPTPNKCATERLCCRMCRCAFKTWTAWVLIFKPSHLRLFNITILPNQRVGAELARDVNEGMAKLVAQHPDRLIGLGTVPLQMTLAWRSKNSKHAIKNLGLRAFSWY
jgi:hypothetical protein